jgi:hypothetical protein
MGKSIYQVEIDHAIFKMAARGIHDYSLIQGKFVTFQQFMIYAIDTVAGLPFDDDAIKSVATAPSTNTKKVILTVEGDNLTRLQTLRQYYTALVGPLHTQKVLEIVISAFPQKKRRTDRCR